MSGDLRRSASPDLVAPGLAHHHRSLPLYPPILRQRQHLISTRRKDGCGTRTRAKYDFEAGARGDDEGRKLVVEC